MKTNNNIEFVKEGILSCCEDIKKNIDDIVKNIKRGKCAGVKISIIVKADEIPRFVEKYNYISADFVNKKTI